MGTRIRKANVADRVGSVDVTKEDATLYYLYDERSTPTEQEINAMLDAAGWYPRYAKPGQDGPVEMPQAEKDAQDYPVELTAKIRAVENTTTELMAAGFEHDGHTFPLDDDQWTKHIANLENAAKSDYLTYPRQISDMSGALYALPDKQSIIDLYVAAIAAYMAIEEAGINLVRALKAATTLAEVRAVVDPRVPEAEEVEEI